VLKKREICRSVRLRCSGENARQLNEIFNSVNHEDLLKIAELGSKGDSDWYNSVTPEMKTLLKAIEYSAAPVLGSVHSKIFRRNELRGIIVKHGLPIIWLTLNPSESQ
jgi:hypothetical protein